MVGRPWAWRYTTHPPVSVGRGCVLCRFKPWMTIWAAAARGDLDEVKRLVEQDAGLLDAIIKWSECRWTPLMMASPHHQVPVVRRLLERWRLS
jgi:hypothetical protein